MENHLLRRSIVSKVGILIFLLAACSESDHKAERADYEYVNEWVEMTLYLSKNTGANSPTYASRALGYIGLAMYESVVPYLEDYDSVLPQLADFESLDAEMEGDPLLSLNAAQAEILRLIYNQTVEENKEKIDSLEQKIKKDLLRSTHREGARISIEWGQKVARKIFERSKSDGGHRAYLRNFDKEWVHPEGPGSWKPPLFAQSFSHHPLHPHWGRNKTFVIANRQINTPDYISYSRDTTSVYYRQFLEVYQKDLSLSQEEKEAALWWGDDPDDTFTPPGHSFYIAMKAVEGFKPSLGKTVETYAKVGIAVADAFIKCWEWKYYHFTERANTYIPQNIDESWESFWPDPPFPSFPSGHAINAGTSAAILIDLYGNDFTFVDDSHVGRERDHVREVDFRARKFDSFWEAAEETANSRFYGGIHIPYDNEVGLRKGREIAKNVNMLRWKNED